jgi:hypothetical protein
MLGNEELNIPMKFNNKYVNNSTFGIKKDFLKIVFLASLKSYIKTRRTNKRKIISGINFTGRYGNINFK